jgi:hypothetical protein
MLSSSRLKIHPLKPNQLLELAAYPSLGLHFGATHWQTRAGLNGRSSTRC